MYEDEIHQIECRWVQSRDLSPIASSYPTHSDLPQRWFNVLRAVVWPEQPNAASGAPESSVAYLMLENRMAALLWRQWTIDAVSLGESGGRRPLVTRILIGTQQLLSPETALALCRAGLHSLAGLPLGQITPGTRMSPVTGRELSGAAAHYSYALDDTARCEPGLDRLISAALRDRSTPLSVQLPPEEIGEPQKGAQVPLLWGLRCTTAALLADVAEGEGRRWSFSTYEKPFQGIQTAGLADVVFRAQQPAQPATIVRPEITVLPRSPAGPSEMDAYDELAIGLAKAYRALGGIELGGRLEQVADEPGFLDRLKGARQVLADFMPCPPASSTPDRTVLEPVMEPTAEPKSGELPRARHAASPEPEHVAAAADTGAVTVPKITEPTGTGRTGPRPGAERMAPGRRYSAEDAAARQPAAGRVQDIASVIDLLAAGPGEPGFSDAFRALQGRIAPSSPQERADARNLLAERGWCMPELVTFDSRRTEAVLEALFKHAVVPDLADPACQLEVASWAYEDMAPTAVIRSLVAAAQQAGRDKPQLLDSALQPALHRRWLVEQSLYYGVSPQISADPVQWAERRERPPWQIFVAGPRSAVVASILFWACIALILALALSLALLILGFGVRVPPLGAR